MLKRWFIVGALALAMVVGGTPLAAYAETVAQPPVTAHAVEPDASQPVQELEPASVEQAGDAPAIGETVGEAAPRAATVGNVDYTINGNKVVNVPLSRAIEAIETAASSLAGNMTASIIVLSADGVKMNDWDTFTIHNDSTNKVSLTIEAGNLPGARPVFEAPSGKPLLDMKNVDLTLRQLRVQGGPPNNPTPQGLERSGAMIQVEGGSLTITDCGVRDSVNTATDGKGGLIYATNQATVFIGPGCNLTDGEVKNGGGGFIYLQDNSELNLESKITGCQAVNGGGIYAVDSTVTLNEKGSVTDCTASANGGGIFAGDSKVVLTGGGTETTNQEYKVYKNTASGNGGGIYMDNSTLSTTITTGGTVTPAIAENKAGQNGGGLYCVRGSGNSTIDHLAVKGNTADGNGGGIYVEEATLTTGTSSHTTSIDNNTAGGNGGGVYAKNATIENPAGTAIGMESNTATGNGGALYLEGSTCKMLLSGIRSNTAASGGGAYLTASSGASSKGSKLTITNGGNIDSNTATAGNGGGVYVTGGSVFNLKGQMSGNKAENGNGGAVFLDTDTANPKNRLQVPSGSSGTILQNNLAKNGAAIYVTGGLNSITDNVLVQTSLTIQSNEASEKAAFYLAGVSRSVLRNTTITGNKAPDVTSSIDSHTEETSCAGMYVASGADVRLARKISIQSNTVGDGGSAREVNLLLQNTGGDMSPVSNVINVLPADKLDGKIGVSLTHWPEEGEFFQILGNQDAGSITGAIQDSFGNDDPDKSIFTIDRVAHRYGASPQTGFSLVVNTKKAIPDAPITTPNAQNNLYVTWRAREELKATAQVHGKYYDGTTAVAAEDITITWPNWQKAGIKEMPVLGTDYTVTAAYKDENVAYTGDPTPQVADKDVTGTIQFTEAFKKKYPDYKEVQAGLTFTGKGKIHPLPLAGTAWVANKYYDGTTTVHAKDYESPQPDAYKVTLKIGTIDPGITAPDDIPAGKEPKAGTDYTLPTPEFGSANASKSVAQTIALNVTWGNTQLAKNYTWDTRRLTANAYIYPIPVTVTVTAKDKYYDKTTDLDTTVKVELDTRAAPQQDMKLPDAFPAGYEPKEGPDWTDELEFSRADVKRDGSGKVTAQYLSGSMSWEGTNYTTSGSLNLPDTATIYPVPVKVTFAANDRGYVKGDSSATLNGTPTAVLGDAPQDPPAAFPSVLPDTLTYGTHFELGKLRFVDKNGNPTDAVGTHTVKADLVEKGSVFNNYAWEVTDAQATIKGRELDITFTPQSKVYDGTDALATYTFDAQPGDPITIAAADYVNITDVKYGGKNAGEKTAVATFTLKDTAVGVYTPQAAAGATGLAIAAVPGQEDTYTATYTSTSDLITQKDITARVTVNDKVYDGSNTATLAENGVAFTGLISGESLTEVDYTAGGLQFGDAVVGENKTVTGTLALNNTAVANNYKLTRTIYAPADIKPWYITPTFTVQGKTYDGTTSVPGYTVTFSNGTPTAPTDVTYTLSPATLVFESKNVGERTVNAELTITNDASKPYVFNDGTFAGSKTIELLAKATITPAELTPALDYVPGKVYDGTTALVADGTGGLRVTLTGLVNGETLTEGTDYTVTGAFQDKNAGTGKAVDVEIAALGTESMKNYTFKTTTLSGAADIARRPVKPANAKAEDKLYDGNTDATITALDLEGVLAGETLVQGTDWQILSAQFDTPDTGNNKAVTVTVELLATPAAQNYVLNPDTTTTTANITNHLEVSGQYSSTVSSGTVTVEEVDTWLRENFAEHFANMPVGTLPQIVWQDGQGNPISGIDKSKAGNYFVQAYYDNGNGQTITFSIDWILTELPDSSSSVPPASSSSVPPASSSSVPPVSSSSVPPASSSSVPPAPSSSEQPAVPPASSTPTPPSTPATIGVQTGDNTPLGLLFAGLGLSLAAATVVLATGARKEKHSGQAASGQQDDVE